MIVAAIADATGWSLHDILDLPAEAVAAMMSAIASGRGYDIDKKMEQASAEAIKKTLGVGKFDVKDLIKHRLI